MPWYYTVGLLGLSLAAVCWAFRESIGDALTTIAGVLNPTNYK